MDWNEPGAGSLGELKADERKERDELKRKEKEMWLERLEAKKRTVGMHAREERSTDSNGLSDPYLVHKHVDEDA